MLANGYQAGQVTRTDSFVAAVQHAQYCRTLAFGDCVAGGLCDVFVTVIVMAGARSAGHLPGTHTYAAIEPTGSAAPRAVDLATGTAAAGLGAQLAKAYADHAPL